MKIKLIYLDDLVDAKNLNDKLVRWNHNVDLEKITSSSSVISGIDVVVIYIEKNIHSSPDINDLIEGYSLNGVRIIGIHSISRINNNIPNILNKVADAIVCWDDSFIKRAVEGEDIFVDAECQLTTKKKISRHAC
jgi:hypothetical protein